MIHVIHDFWMGLGSPSWISGTNVALFLSLAKYIYSKIKYVKSLEQDIEFLKIKLENLDRLLNTRLDDHIKDNIDRVNE